MKKCDEAKKCMCNIRKNVMKFLDSDWDMKDKSMVIAIVMMAGIIIGFLISPIKGGLVSNNRIGCNNTDIKGIEDEEDDEFEI